MISFFPNAGLTKQDVFPPQNGVFSMMPVEDVGPQTQGWEKHYLIFLMSSPSPLRCEKFQWVMGVFSPFKSMRIWNFKWWQEIMGRNASFSFFFFLGMLIFSIARSLLASSSSKSRVTTQNPVALHFLPHICYRNITLVRILWFKSYFPRCAMLPILVGVGSLFVSLPQSTSWVPITPWTILPTYHHSPPPYLIPLPSEASASALKRYPLLPFLPENQMKSLHLALNFWNSLSQVILTVRIKISNSLPNANERREEIK